MTARERRFDAREKGYVSQIEDDVRASFAVVNQVAHTMKREFERLQTMTRPTTAPDGGAEPVEAAAVSSLDSHKYVGFEDLYRGSTDDISRRLTGYLDDFSGASDVLDIGCGRGEIPRAPSGTRYRRTRPRQQPRNGRGLSTAWIGL